MNTEEKAKLHQISESILELSRNTLLVNFRYLDRAVSNLKFLEDDNFSFETDGETLFYNCWFVLSQYRDEPSAITRDLLHSYLHCVFMHSFVGSSIDRTRWNLACDIAVENTISELNSPCVRSSRENLQASLIATIKGDTGILTAERIYKWLKDSGLSDEELEKERIKFLGDGHGLWYGENDSRAREDKNVNLRKIWEDVSKRMQVETDMLKQGKGALAQNLRSLNRSKRTYTEFLKKFSVLGEVMQVSDDEFDNNYYIYGLDTYGNMPLIEMLEYSEQKRLREFAIAIDTSGSVKGEIVQNFIQHTYNILSSGENFFSKINVIIIQCDYIIRDVAVITCREDFDAYIKNLEIKGLERTDFRPVFEYINSKIETGEFTDFRGLIYFTDGDGMFPQNAPKYETAFVIHRDDYAEIKVPDWAMSMTIQEDAILDKNFSN